MWVLKSGGKPEGPNMSKNDQWHGKNGTDQTWLHDYCSDIWKHRWVHNAILLKLLAKDLNLSILKNISPSLAKNCNCHDSVSQYSLFHMSAFEYRSTWVSRYRNSVSDPWLSDGGGIPRILMLFYSKNWRLEFTLPFGFTDSCKCKWKQRKSKLNPRQETWQIAFGVVIWLFL